MTATAMVVVDSSFLVAIFLPADKNHSAALRWLSDNYPQSSLVTPSLARCEFASALSRNGVSGKHVDEALSALDRRFTVIDTSEELLRVAAQIARDYKVRGCDSVFVALAMRQKAGLVTFDRDQSEKADTLVRVSYLKADEPSVSSPPRRGRG